MKIITVLICTLLSASIFSQTTVWNPDSKIVDSGLWTEGENWTLGVPNEFTVVILNNPDAAECVMNTTVLIDQLVMGSGGNGGILRIADGGLLSTSDAWSGIGWTDTATLVVDAGGTINFGSNLWIGWDSLSTGTLRINGGVVNVAGMYGTAFGRGENQGRGFVYVNDGGELNLTGFDSVKSIPDGSLLDISGGSVSIKGNHVASVQNYIAASKITAFEGKGDLQVHYINDTTQINSASVTFQVDSRKAIELYKAGSMLLEFANGDSYEMADRNNDAIYKLTLQKSEIKDLRYRFVYQTNNKEKIIEESAANECFNADGYRLLPDLPNENLTLPELEFDKCTEVPKYSEIEFRVDLKEVSDLYEGGSVFLTLSDRDSAFSMTDKQGKGIYSYKLSLDEGVEINYHFSYQSGPGITNLNREILPDSCNFKNYRRITIPANNLSLPAVLFGSCDPYIENITAIRFGSTDNPLNGLTIAWNSIGGKDSIAWGYTENFEKGVFPVNSSKSIIGVSCEYSFPNVKPASTLYYTIYDSKDEVWQQTSTFNTVPDPKDEKFTFTAFGDSRSNVDQWQIISEATSDTDFTLFLGDIVNKGSIANNWKAWFGFGSKYIARELMYHCVGNHDRDNSLSKFDNFLGLFTLPGNELYYSFNYSNAVFICLNSEMASDTTQYAWLLATLEANKDKTWKFVFYHKPFYTGPTHVGEMDAYFPTWWKAFDDYGVDMIFNGHTHNYQRTKPINRNVSTSSPVDSYGSKKGEGRCQVVAGNTGAPLSNAADSGLWWLANSKGIRHYTQIDIDGEVLEFKAIDAKGDIFDQFIIDKSN